MLVNIITMHQKVAKYARYRFTHFLYKQITSFKMLKDFAITQLFASNCKIAFSGIQL